MGRTGIFIDGAYFQYTVRNEFGGVRISYAKLVEKLACGREILRSYFYDCEPYQSGNPTKEEVGCQNHDGDHFVRDADAPRKHFP